MIRRIFRDVLRSNMLRFDEEGSALVEVALSLPMLALMLLGAAEFGSLAYGSIEVANAAHAAAMYASSGQTALTDSAGISSAATADAGNLKGSNVISVVSVTTNCTCANSAYTPTSCSDNATCIQNNTSMVTAVTVATQSSFSPLIRIPGGAFTYTMQGQSTQVVSNQ